MFFLNFWWVTDLHPGRSGVASTAFSERVCLWSMSLRLTVAWSAHLRPARRAYSMSLCVKPERFKSAGLASCDDLNYCDRRRPLIRSDARRAKHEKLRVEPLARSPRENVGFLQALRVPLPAPSSGGRSIPAISLDPGATIRTGGDGSCSPLCERQWSNIVQEGIALIDT